jgi:glyoxylase-like metal-dependent hydrolase (beta-lactamase superfamily II)
MTSAHELPVFARLVLAPNPGPMTLDGTNTWVLRVPGDPRVVVVDPGPAHDEHLEAVAAHGDVALVLLTHGHLDHAEGAPPFHVATGAPVAAIDPALCRGDTDPLTDGLDLHVGGLHVRVLATPGHSGDSATFVVDVGGDDVGGDDVGGDDVGGDNGASRVAVLTGDTVLGRGPSVVAHPDGRLDDYLTTLRRLRDLGTLTVLPGHGPVRPDLAAAAAEYLAHRAERLEQVRAAVAAGAETVDDVLDVVYADTDPVLRRAAAMSVRAQLDFLRDSAPR